MYNHVDIRKKSQQQWKHSKSSEKTNRGITCMIMQKVLPVYMELLSRPRKGRKYPHEGLKTTGSREVELCGQQYKIELYFPVLDTFVAEMDRRFTSQNIEVMKAIRSCSPESDHFLDPNSLTSMVEAYGLDADSITMEAALAKRLEADKISDLVHEIYPLKNAFPNLFQLLCIAFALTIVVSTAECERNFWH